MRIAFVSTILDYPWGGADTLWTHAAEAARARGDALFVAVSRPVAEHGRIAALQAHLHVREQPEVPRSLVARAVRKMGRLVASGDAVTGAVDRFRPDLVIISLGGTYDLVSAPSWCEWLVRGKASFSLIANFQVEAPILGEPERERARRLFMAASGAFFVSNRNLEVTRRHLGLPLGNAGVVQNPLRWRPADRSPWPDESVFSFSAVARLEPVKGIQLLLPALAQSLGAQKGWRLRIYGKGPDEAGLRAQASSLGIGAQVEFRGYVDDLRSIWAENHMLVSPAIDEGVPMTIPEAMLCARPVLATSVGGAADWITPGSSGFLCPPASVDSLAVALREAWACRARWRQMGEFAGGDAAARYRPADFQRLIPPSGPSSP